MADNEPDVIRQMEEAGLVPKLPLEFNTGKPIRCQHKDSGGKLRSGKQGWYYLYSDFTVEDPNAPGGRKTLITGSFGYFQGGEKFIAKVELKDIPKRQLSPEQKAERRRREAQAAKQAENELKSRQKAAAFRAQWVWYKCQPTAVSHDYLGRKQIKAYDIRYTPPEKLVAPKQDTNYEQDEETWRRIPPHNALAIPIQDVQGTIWGLQFILDRTTHKARIEKRGDKDKEFWPQNVKIQGHFFQIGPLITDICLVCEGYATGCTLHEATGLPVAVVFNANNIKPALENLLAYYPNAKFLICADDDDLYGCQECHKKIQLSKISGDDCPHCGKPHLRTNAGVAAAMKACQLDRTLYITPKFPNPEARWESYTKNQGKLTDFNDLHCTSSLSQVRKQVEAVLSEFGWSAGSFARTMQQGGEGDSGKQDALKISSLPEAIDRLWMIYATSSVYDEKFKMIYPIKAFFDNCSSSDITKQWRESPHRKHVLLENIGFDPAGNDPNIICNLWDSWPTTPIKGDCDLILDLILYLCSGEANPTELAAWLIKWIAYPIQNPGAKMQTATVLFGPQGTGKNILGDCIKKIYGKYAATISQRALETQFNDFLSKKLFIVANEIASRSEAYEMKNALKTFITDNQIWINPKGAPAYFETNHVNIMFFSNDRMPLVLEQDDRRHCVIWTPAPKPDDYYIKVANQIENGGAMAFYGYLLSIDLGDYNEHSKPPMTIAKQELIDLAKPSTIRFADEWRDGLIDGLPFVPVQRDDLYDAFLAWAKITGHSTRRVDSHSLVDLLSKIPNAKKSIKRVDVLIGNCYVEKQRTFYFFPGCEEKKPGDPDKFFFNECVRRFRDGVSFVRTGSS